MRIKILYKDRYNNDKLTEELIETPDSSCNVIKFIDGDSELELNLNNGDLTNIIDYNDIDYLIIDDKYYIMNGSRC